MSGREWVMLGICVISVATVGFLCVELILLKRKKEIENEEKQVHE